MDYKANYENTFFKSNDHVNVRKKTEQKHNSVLKTSLLYFGLA